MPIRSTSFARSKVGFVLVGGGTSDALKISPSSNLTVAYAAGSFWLGGKYTTILTGTVTHAAAHASLGRIDVIQVNDSGTVSIIQGTPAASPTPPVTFDDVILLAQVTVAAGATVINSADIQDLRDLGGISVDGTTISISSGGVLSVNQSGLNQFPAVVGAQRGTTAITGNGAAQTVFSKSFTALTDGETLLIEVHVQVTATLGLDTPDAVLSSSGVTLDTLTMNPGSNPNFVFWESHAGYSSTANRGYVCTIRKAQSAAITSPVEAGTLTTALATLTLTVDPAIGTNLNVAYNYRIIKFGTGV